MNKTFTGVAYAAQHFSELLHDLRKHEDGFTYSNDFLESPKEGICVAVAATQGNFGGWLDPQAGKFYFDAVRIFGEVELAAALKFAAANDQLSVFRLSDFTTFNLGANVPNDGRPVMAGFMFVDTLYESQVVFEGGLYKFLSDGNKVSPEYILYWREKETEVKPDLKPSYPANILPNDNRYINITYKSGRQIEGFYEGGEYLDENADHIDIESISHWQEI